MEQPVHYKELGECYKIAQNQKVYFGVGNLYLNLPAVQNFIRNVHIVSKTKKIAYINVDLATQVSYPVISIFGRSASDTSPMGECGKYMRSCALSDGNCKDWRYSNKFQST